MSNKIIGSLLRSLFVASIVCVSANVVHAWPLVSQYRNSWGVDFGSWDNLPTGTSHANFCVGNTVSSSGGCQKPMGIHGDDEAVVGLVAWKINDNGGYFCVTQFQCEGKKSSYTWNLAPNGVQKCFWLCKDGFSGSGCTPIVQSEYSLTTGNAACDSTTIARTDFNSNTVRTSGSTGLNQEYNIDLLHNRYAGGKEMDVMVGVSNWLENKKGVVASPFLFWCTNRAASNDMDINFYTQYKSETLCLPGFTGPNCEKCKPKRMCSGYDAAQFDASKHTMTMNGGCSEFRCTDTTMGFKSANDKNDCVACAKLGGVGNDGSCVTCSVGQNFDKKTKTCRQAQTFTKDDMQYGKGKDSDIPLNDQCWQHAEPTKYESCVTGTMQASASGINLERESCLFAGGTWGTSCTCPGGRRWSFVAGVGKCS